MDYIATADGMADKATVNAQPKVQDVKAPETKPEESTMGPANSDLASTTVSDSEASETAEEAAAEVEKPAEETTEEEEKGTDGGE
jgi:hypothetical protein